MKQLDAGQLTAAEAAQAMGRTEARALELLEVYTLARDTVAAERGHHTRVLRRRLTVAAAVAAGVALAVPLWASTAWAATCTSTLPAPMVTLCPNNPAVASELNGNFQQIVTWVQQKVGPVGNASLGNISAVSISSGSISTGAINASSLSAPGAVSGGTVFASGDLRSTGNIWENRSRNNAILSTNVDCSSGNCLSVTPYSLGAWPTQTNFITCPNGQFMCGVGLSYVGGNGNFWQSLQVVPECCGL